MNLEPVIVTERPTRKEYLSWVTLERKTKVIRNRGRSPSLTSRRNASKRTKRRISRPLALPNTLALGRVSVV